MKSLFLSCTRARGNSIQSLAPRLILSPRRNLTIAHLLLRQYIRSILDFTNCQRARMFLIFDFCMRSEKKSWRRSVCARISLLVAHLKRIKFHVIILHYGGRMCVVYTRVYIIRATIFEVKFEILFASFFTVLRFINTRT